MKRFEFTTEITAGITIHAENEQDARERIYYMLGDGQDFVLHPACTLFVKLIEEEDLILEDERDPFDESIEDKFATAGVNVIPEGGIEPQVGPVLPTYIIGVGEVPTPSEYDKGPTAEQKKAVAKLLLEKPIGNPPGNWKPDADNDTPTIEELNEEDAPTTITFEPEERDLILAALRLWQATEGGWHSVSSERRADILMISTNDAEHAMLDDESIDDLCERINV